MMLAYHKTKNMNTSVWLMALVDGNIYGVLCQAVEEGIRGMDNNQGKNDRGIKIKHIANLTKLVDLLFGRV